MSACRAAALSSGSQYASAAYRKILEDTGDATMRRHARSSPKKRRIPDLTYPVGYARPPEHSQYKKGQSGNPNGRPKGSRNWSTVFAEELARPISYMIDGKPTITTVLDALIHDAVERAIAGSMRHIELLLRDEYSEDPDRVKVIVIEGGIA